MTRPFGYAAWKTSQKGASQKWAERSRKASPKRSTKSDDRTTTRWLGNVLKQNPQCYDHGKITVVERFITDIEELPDRLQAVETIYFSNNNLRHLRGFKQFHKLRVLSLANNCIDQLESVCDLAAIRTLQVLTLEGNPISYAPNYRSYVILALPQLKVLDNKEITAEERLSADVAMKKEQSLLRIMFLNQCAILKLERVLQLIKLHRELRGCVFGRISALNISEIPNFLQFNVNRFMNQCDYENRVDDVERHRVYQRLRDEVYRAWRSRGGHLLEDNPKKEKATTKGASTELWDVAFTEVLMKQQHTIASLMSSCEMAAKTADQELIQWKKSDPSQRISALRNNERRQAESRAEEREAIIKDLTANLDTTRLSTGGGRTMSRTMSETRLRAMQQQPQQQYIIPSSPSLYQQSMGENMYDTGHTGYTGYATSQPSVQGIGSPSRTAPVGHATVTMDTQPFGTGNIQRAQVPPFYHTPTPAHNNIPSIPASPTSAPPSRNIPQVEYRLVHARDAESVIARENDFESETRPSRQEKQFVEGTLMSRSARASALPPQQEEPAYSELQDRHQRSVTFNPTASGKGTHLGTRSAAPLRSSRMRAVSPGRQHSPPLALTREVETLRRQVELLHADIEKRAEEEGRLQHINLQLRERLEQFRQQNVENVNRAESELVSLQQQLTKENEVRQTLQSRLESVEKEKQQFQERAARTDPTVELNWKSQVQELSQRKSALEEELLRSHDESLRVERQLSETASKLRQAVKEAEWVKTKADEYSTELRFYAQLEAKQELASEHYAKRLKRRVWTLLRQAIRKTKYFQHILERRSEEYHQTLIQLCLMAWKDHQRRNYAIKLKLQARQQLRCWQFLHAWSVSVLMAKRGIRSKQRRSNQWLRQCLASWMQYRKIRHTRHQQQIKGEYLHARALLRTNFRLWKVYPNRFDLDTETERRLTRLAVLHRTGSLRNKGIRAWRKWIKTFARVRRDKERYATNIYHSSLLSRGLRCLHLAVEMHRDERRRNRQLNQRYLNRTLKRCMTLWAKHCKHQSRKMKMVKKQNRFNMKRRFKSWRGQLLELVLNRRFLAVAETVAHKHLSRSTFKRWRKHLHSMRRLRALEQKTIKHIQVNLTRNVLTKWRLQAYQSRQDKHTRREEMLTVMRQGLHRWIQFRARKRLSRRRHKEALRFRREWVRTHACLMLEAWHRYLKRKQRYRQLASLVGRRRGLLVCRALVQEWQSNVRRALKTSFVDMKAHCNKLQDSLQLQSNRVTSVDIENLELVDRLHELSAEMAKMKLQIQDRDNQLTESRQAFERMVVREESLKTELARFRISEEDWAQQVKTLEQLLRERMESIDEESANKKLHELSSNKVVNSLKEELENNKQTLRTVEERLKQCRQQKEDSVREHEEKLQAAFEMASQLRNIVLEKDRVIEELQAHVQELDVRLSDSSSRVAASGQALVQSVSARDGRIEDLQSQIANLTLQLQQAQVVSNQWQMQAEEREGEIRKLRYEVQLLADREDQRTDTFLNQLANSQAGGSAVNTFTTTTNPTFLHHRPASTTYATAGYYGVPDQDRFDYGAVQDTQMYRDHRDYDNAYSAVNQPVGSTQPYPYGSLYSPQLPQRDTVSFSPVQPTGNVTATAAATYIPEKPFGFVDAVPVPAVPSDNRDLHDEIHQLQERIMNRLRSPKSVIGSTTEYHQQPQHPVISEFRLDPALVSSTTVSTSAVPVAGLDLPISTSTGHSLRASTTYPRISYQSSAVSQPAAVSSSTVGSIPAPYPSLTANFPQFSSLLGSAPTSTSALGSAAATETTQVPVTSSSLSGFDMEAPRGSRAFTADLVSESHNVSESFMRNRESTRSELDRKLDDLAAKLKSVRSPDIDPMASRTTSLAQLTQRFDQLERKLSMAAGSESGACEPSRDPDQPEST